MATTTLAPQTDSFKATVADLYGDDRFYAVVGQVATDARAKLPHAVARIERAVQIVLDGGITLRDDGTAVVHSQTDQNVEYVVNGHCECPDAQHQAPEGLCKHRLSTYIYRRVQQRLTALDVEYTPLPQGDGCQVVMDQDGVPCEAVNATCPGHAAEAITPEPATDTAMLTPYIVYIHGKAFVQYTGLLKLAQARGLQRLEARFISVTPELALAEATATFTDGRVFSECSDSTPDNVGTKIKMHFPRMALTRSKSRCLRDALGIDMVAIEELGE